MVLSQAREYAQDFANQPVKEAVITVPPFFNQAERRAVMHAAELANIKVLQLMNANTAGKSYSGTSSINLLEKYICSSNSTADFHVLFLT